MDHLLGSVQQSTESSRKFIVDALSGLRKEIKSIKDKQSAQNNNDSNLAPVQHVMLSEKISVPAQSRRRKKRHHFVPTVDPEQEMAKTKEDLCVHNRFMVILFFLFQSDSS